MICVLARVAFWSHHTYTAPTQTELFGALSPPFPSKFLDPSPIGPVCMRSLIQSSHQTDQEHKKLTRINDLLWLFTDTLSLPQTRLEWLWWASKGKGSVERGPSWTAVNEICSEWLVDWLVRIIHWVYELWLSLGTAMNEKVFQKSCLDLHSIIHNCSDFWIGERFLLTEKR